MSLAKPQGQGSMITKTQGVCLVRIMDTLVILSHNDGLGTNMVTLVSNTVDIAVGLLRPG
jgi:hypothetical protein